MFSNIKHDFARYYKIELGNTDPTLIRKIRLLLKMPGLQSILIYRLGYWILQEKNNVFFSYRVMFLPVYVLLSYLTTKMYGINISVRANIGSGLYVGHFAGIEVGKSQIGSNCSIHQHVKINSKKLISDNQQTMVIIGNNTWIGPHAVINSPVTISDGVTISSGSRVVSNIDSASLVMGDPARIIRKDFDNSLLL
ncbi:MAG: hypothetical protein OEY89_10590 [Gammaproteobacteria bacterium]|nr:hypothetical protein [Gammaproteobacteria bacterium]